MIPIRYSKRTLTDQAQIDAFLSHAKVGNLGLSNGDEPYIVPLNFCWWNGQIYFHGADSGRKVEMIDANSRVCFSVTEEYGTIADPIPAHTDTAYMSVFLSGTIARVQEPEEMRDAMQAMLDKYVPSYYKEQLSLQHVLKYRSSMGSVTAVFRITPDSLTAKGSPVPEEKLYYPGRTVGDDTGKPAQS
ncbi:pyridoxamine 5'-phosphate oxidase family protein [Brevibacillus centrosporus]|uniref:pyridoxamine 5'-phosphate oxidase family protein n=1 Tax=Brevibacillus centrosporus TaxID=54910 RepID=UPI003B01015E